MCLQDDVVHIQDTTAALETRWKELLAFFSARKREIDENYKMSYKFFKGMDDLMKMLNEAAQNLKDDEPIGVDPTHLRIQLKKHKVQTIQSIPGSFKLFLFDSVIRAYIWCMFRLYWILLRFCDTRYALKNDRSR